MRLKTFFALLLVGALAPPEVRGQSVADVEVAQGIKQVEEGDLDKAIFTLDGAARRLSADPSRTSDLAQAYLYLGVAYLGKGHEMAARAKFKEAVQQLRDLSLSPDQFPPKVIDIFEAAKAEVAQSAAPAKPSAAAPSPSIAPVKKGGSKTPLILVGAAAAAGGVALAVGGGGSAGSNSATSSTAQPQTFGPALLTIQERFKEFDVTPTAAGTLQATLTWPETRATLVLYLYDPATSQELASSGGSAGTTKQISATVQANRRYRVGITHCLSAFCSGPVSTSDATITLRFTHP